MDLRFSGRSLVAGALSLSMWLSPPVSANDAVDRKMELIVAVGEPGEKTYETSFLSQVKGWRTLGKKAGIECVAIGLDDPQDDKSDRSRLLEHVSKLSTRPDTPLCLVLIGHGTHDGRDAKFNLRGPDLTPSDLASAMAPLKQEVAVIHTGSASGIFVKALSKPNRIIITATKSADEIWATRFGDTFVEALDDADSGADQDRQVSLLEAWLHSAASVSRSYEEDGRLATEHSVLDDNGDGVGTRSEAFDGLKLAQPPKEGTPDGSRARQWVLLLGNEEAKLSDDQRSRRNALERQLEALTSRQSNLPEQSYYTQLEDLLLRIAAIYAEGPETSGPSVKKNESE